TIPGQRVGGLYKTTDYGETWKRIAFGGHNMWALDVKEDDAGAIHVATGSHWNALDSGLVAYSTDGGASWDEYKDDALPWVYTRPGSLDIIITMKNSPFYNQKRLLLGTDEGFFYLDPYGVSATPDPVTSGDTPIRIHRSNDVLVARVRSELPLEHPVIRVYDIAGGTVHSSIPDVSRFSEDDYEFHMPAMSAGAYYLVLSSNAGTYSVPFVLD
ncbi:MAG: WD40/YVTN/BNR-like repeat-containing protein, partial [Candidatus Kapaibacterium sp.]